MEADYHIQLRGNSSLPYGIMKRYKKKDSKFRNRHLESLAKTAEMASEDHGQFLDRLVTKKKTVAMNTEEKLENYLIFLCKHQAKSQCLKGEELMFVEMKSDQFIPPSSLLLKKG